MFDVKLNIKKKKQLPLQSKLNYISNNNSRKNTNRMNYNCYFVNSNLELIC